MKKLSALSSLLCLALLRAQQERQQKAIDALLTNGAQSFTDTADQDRYDECEAAVNNALQSIKQHAKHLKVGRHLTLTRAAVAMPTFQGILPKDKYYTAIGSIANAALSRMLRDILALPDIPEVESHRLSELCHILNSLEGLFSEESGVCFFVRY